MSAIRDAIELERKDWDGAMNAWFAIAAELWWRGAVPMEWSYSPGMAVDPREEEHDLYEEGQGATDEELIHAGNVLQRYVRMLEASGHGGG